MHSTISPLLSNLPLTHDGQCGNSCDSFNLQMALWAIVRVFFHFDLHVCSIFQMCIMLVKVSSLNSLYVLKLKHTCEHLHSFLPSCEVFSEVVFYLHSWLLERVIKISSQTSAGSLTALR
jgi:hypothetical protein